MVPRPGSYRCLLHTLRQQVQRLSETDFKDARQTPAALATRAGVWRRPVSATLVLRQIQAYRPGNENRISATAANTLGGTAFYRRRTESLLRRYMRISMEMGRTPSLLGNSIFRGRVSSYRLRTFEDCIIFLFDVEKCLKRLDEESKDMIARIALQEYTQEETARLTHQSERSVGRKYAFARDQLTSILLEMGPMNPDVF